MNFINILRQRRFSIIYLLALPVITTQCHALASSILVKSQTNSHPVAGVVRIASPIQKGNVAGEHPTLIINGSDLKDTLLAQSAPDVWLVFNNLAESSETGNQRPNNKSTVRVDLPLQGKQLLSLYWIAALSYQYDVKFKQMSGVNDYSQRATALRNSYRMTVRELKNVAVDAPSGKRMISHNEAADLVTYVGTAAADMIDQTKK